MTYLKLPLLLLAMLAVGALASPPTASAITNHGIRGTCGIHAGKLLRRDSDGTIYRMRIGPRIGHSAGSMHCRGHYLRKGAAADRCCFGWGEFDFPHWRTFFNGRVLVTGFESALTAQGCRGFAINIAAAVATEGGASPGLALNGAGCAWGVYVLSKQILPVGGRNNPNLHLVVK